MNTNNNNIPNVYIIDGINMLQLPSTLNSGLYKFCEVEDREEIHLYTKDELPKYILNELEYYPTINNIL